MLFRSERIRELAKQAGWNGFEALDERNEKFAELIVRDCVRVCNKVYFDDYPDAEDFERSEEGEAIKRHFGVK